MTTVVTGAAGFIGSQIAAACLDDGQEVIGVDLMTDYYDVTQKEANLSSLLTRANFEFHRIDKEVQFAVSNFSNLA